ncbi:D-lactate dehydrogenase (cytochrome) [Candidatus Pelagibacter sp. HTCC7211]|uniref:FAD-binding oxidoreductase n=1 Tax=Pelagibacter sp. (strain HTCC7211) TaxID=439493 RepID=UPI000183A1EB|nr:FAD-linked oxidase C-terminal domain-containing protein [Candidatus Pelagibacter sp. HTCC7211]EDZ60839.1 D-lactate dehydrogenase (cytochrome) [Candidatus Pelagibacter sp. HTCC7211]
MNEQVQLELKKLLHERISTSESTRTTYARGEDTYDPILSKAVVFPESNEEVSKILSLCNENKIPVVPFGTGTSLEGNVVGNDKGITISLEKMNKILSVHVEDFDCRVQACVTREQLNDYLREDGVFFPIDPGANAALGGMAATSASGTMAVKYGTMKTVISGLTVVLANGDIINTGTRTKKTSAGYNLTNLFIGSEGTLGIITEVQLRLSPIPESIMAAVCHFPTLENAVQTAQQVIQYGVPIARIEMLNKEQMGISINYSNLKGVEEVPTLFFEFHGSELSNQENIKIVEEISKDNRGSSFKWAKDLEERNKLWKARWDVYYSVKALIKNGRVYSTDICVPISNITECVNFAEEQAEKFGLRAPMVGHLGDGNFHVILPYDPAKKEMYDKIREFNDLLIKKGLELNGTITGEHGVGLHKKKYLLEQHADNIPVMKSIKRTLDANNIMNPGKIFDLN